MNPSLEQSSIDTTTMMTSSEPLVEVPKILEEERIQKERMHDVLLLLEHLVEREEATVKLILDCLYDVGSVNLINKKFQSRSLNWMMKSIARMSKPAFRVVALRWFKKNCPELITKWLQEQVQGSTEQGVESKE
ncbi:MAG: hypothetical protein F6J98_14405 [Moorea sp. SIO4G2]|uniref:hypothetical protein n=1 Tax=unclassified Moorena TaxID=2683338 RepID=UPI0013CBA482|nr:MULTISPECIES: hypothetical protein [unclassified Moorena]NEO50539.1 hypothetical protein [Moorena sp. SIO4A3]NEO61556.1 hypothetical protein [Moorena sp. SIO4G2]NEO23842.1 hypothetical protein [Moorena sp. SIO4A5]NEO80935.1 hypothetical protein [Moorena sp. SIO4G3]NEP27273.1 hypothetical protein [Moorena sp. SIO3I6]